MILEHTNPSATTPTLLGTRAPGSEEPTSDKKKSTFIFRKKKEAINWRLLASVNIDKIAREVKGFLKLDVNKF
jgi:hypothetical protein